MFQAQFQTQEFFPSQSVSWAPLRQLAFPRKLMHSAVTARSWVSLLQLTLDGEHRLLDSLSCALFQAAESIVEPFQNAGQRLPGVPATSAAMILFL